MERSLINEFKSSNSTLFHSTVLGTTSLLQRPNKEGELYKSRIAHLPADPRPDLSRKLDFVVVFQAVEIERLAQEAAGLRGRLRETEGRGLHQASYEVQIRELMERCSKLESEKYSYREELTQTKSASQSIFHELSLLQGRYSEVDFCAAEKYKLEKARGEELSMEIEKWKGRYGALERAKAEEQEGLRRMMEAQKDALGSREIKDLMNRFELEKEELLDRLRERKEQLDERELQMKKLHNCYEQLQVRTQEDEAKVDSYQEKVAMLSQETYRLNELLRAKSEEIRNLKLINQQDFSLKMSQINSLDQTKHQLNDRLRFLEDENENLRDEGRVLAEQTAHMKRKLVEVERLEFQLREAKEDSENKLKAMERKDKKIIALQEEMRQAKKVEDEVKRLKASNLKMQAELRNLQQRLDSKIEQLRQVKQQQATFIRWRQDYNQKIQVKLNEFANAYQSLEQQNNDIRSVSQQTMEKSAIFELKSKEFAIQLKEKDYRITSLQNELRQQEAKVKTKEVETNNVLQQLESHLFAERRNFEERLEEAEGKRRDGEQYVRQAESKYRQVEVRAREAEQKVKDSQSYQVRARNLEAECSQLESWGRSLESKNHQLQLHIGELESHLIEMEDERAQLRGVLEGQAEFYHQTEQRYFQSGQELKSLKARLDNIEKILITLKNTVGLRLKNAHDEDRRLQTIEHRYDELFQWFVSVNANYEGGLKDSPTKQPYNSFFNSNESSRYSTSLDRTALSPLHRARSSERTRENINSGNNREQEPSIEAAIRHILLCVEVESLRKRVGDKNAKVESMRNSIVARGYGQQPSGFFTNREPSAGKKTIYY